MSLITLEQCLKGKATQIKGKEYLSTAAYVEPFLEKMSKYTDNFIVNAILADQISIDENREIKKEDSVFNRIWIQAVIPSNLCYENHEEVIGLVYGLDVKQPIAKIYKGSLDKACTNLCVFSPSFLEVQKLNPKENINYKCIDSLMSKTNDIKSILTRLEETEVPYNPNIINENLGMWVRNALHYEQTSEISGKVKVSTSSIIKAYKYLYENEKSRYFIKKDEVTNMLNVYGALTQVITDDKKDIINKCEKTLLVKDILGI